ncbi:MAG: DUF2786 domain-containing protein [Deltaproteobacteria bacterium]|nr:DUF2786 domain-containing protein [Deltaproteobacteria bacterium]
MTIDFIESKQYWGYWDNTRRLIGININLPIQQPWSTVLGILTHETAHQLVHDLYPESAASQPPHGPKFHQVAYSLRLSPVYCSASVDLTDSGAPPLIFGPFNEDESQEHPILVKIKKLLALSQSPEPHEATTALDLAGRLMAKYNIERWQISSDESEQPFQRWRINLYSTKLTPIDFLITKIISAFFFTRTIFTWEFNPLSLKIERCIELNGRPVNLHMANHVYHFLKERTQTLWEYHKPRLAALGEKGLGAKNAFIKNLLNTFYRKLAKSQAESLKTAPATTRDLILSKDPKLEEFVRYNFPHMTTIHSNSGHTYAPNSVATGSIEGQKLSILPPVSSSNNNGFGGYIG